MDDVTVTCPYCGETVELQLEDDVVGNFVQDCEVCCHPWAVHVQRDEEGELTVSVDRST